MICRVIDTVVRGHIFNFERIHTFQAPNVVSILLRVRATLMVGVYATRGAEVVLRGIGIELIEF